MGRVGDALAAFGDRAEHAEREAVALSYAVRDARTPWHAKLLAGFLVAYVASPVDPIPDFLPVVGFLDEVVLVPVGVAAVRRLVPEAVLVDARERADDRIEAGRGRLVVAALAVVLWVVVGWLALRALARV